jgi:hypothetical protein
MYIDVGDLVGTRIDPTKTGIVTKKRASNNCQTLSRHAEKISFGFQFVYYVYFSGDDLEQGPYYQSELQLKQHL